MEGMYEIKIPLLDEELVMPQFTATITLAGRKREPEWKTPEEIVRYSVELGLPIRSRSTLLNYERRNRLKALRVSARKVFYDLNEVKDLFNSTTQ